MTVSRLKMTTVGNDYGKPSASDIVEYYEHYPKIKSSMKNAGVDKGIKEARRQLDEFLDNNK